MSGFLYRRINLRHSTKTSRDIYSAEIVRVFVMTNFNTIKVVYSIFLWSFFFYNVMLLERYMSTIGDLE